MFDSFLDSQDCCALKRRTCFALFLENIGLQPKAHQAGKKSAVKSHGKKISCKSRQQIRLPVRKHSALTRTTAFFGPCIAKTFFKKSGGGGGGRSSAAAAPPPAAAIATALAAALPWQYHHQEQCSSAVPLYY